MSCRLFPLATKSPAQIRATEPVPIPMKGASTAQIGGMNAIPKARVSILTVFFCLSSIFLSSTHFFSMPFLPMHFSSMTFFSMYFFSMYFSSMHFSSITPHSQSKPSQTGVPVYVFSSSSPSITRMAPAAMASISNSPG